MIVLISPAKSLDFETPAPPGPDDEPAFLDQSELLVRHMRTLSPDRLSDLMKIGDRLAVLNHERFASWSRPFDRENAKPALFAFTGDVYRRLDATSLPPRAIQWAQKHLRMLSGLYGLLRPFDLIQPYRLEMGLRLEVKGKASIYEFWGSKVTQAVNHALDEAGGTTVVNLASAEYSKVLQAPEIQGDFVTPAFQQTKKGRTRVIGLHAKRARGTMSRYLALQQASDPADVLGFADDGYELDSGASTDQAPVFVKNLDG